MLTLPNRALWLITGNNPLSAWPDQKRAREALAGLDLLVHMDLFANQTSAYADYLLPAATGIEKGGISRLAEDRRIVWNERLIDPPGEARSDHWFWIELGRRLGYGEVLPERFKDPAVFWSEAFSRATPDLRGVTLQRRRQALPDAERPARVLDPRAGGALRRGGTLGAARVLHGARAARAAAVPASSRGRRR